MYYILYTLLQVRKSLLRSASGNFTEILVFAYGTIENGHARHGAYPVQQSYDEERFGRVETGTRRGVQPMDPAGVSTRSKTQLDPVPGDVVHGRRLGSHGRTRARS